MCTRIPVLRNMPKALYEAWFPMTLFIYHKSGAVSSSINPMWMILQRSHTWSSSGNVRLPSGCGASSPKLAFCNASCDSSVIDSVFFYSKHFRNQNTVSNCSWGHGMPRTVPWLTAPNVGPPRQTPSNWNVGLENGGCISVTSTVYTVYRRRCSSSHYHGIY